MSNSICEKTAKCRVIHTCFLPARSAAGHQKYQKNLTFNVDHCRGIVGYHYTKLTFPLDNHELEKNFPLFSSFISELNQRVCDLSIHMHTHFLSLLMIKLNILSCWGRGFCYQRRLFQILRNNYNEAKLWSYSN